jgi:hypothetical protein
VPGECSQLSCSRSCSQSASRSASPAPSTAALGFGRLRRRRQGGLADRRRGWRGLVDLEERVLLDHFVKLLLVVERRELQQAHRVLQARRQGLGLALVEALIEFR